MPETESHEQNQEISRMQKWFGKDQVTKALDLISVSSSPARCLASRSLAVTNSSSRYQLLDRDTTLPTHPDSMTNYGIDHGPIYKTRAKH